jgi:hypothetical protein
MPRGLLIIALLGWGCGGAGDKPAPDAPLAMVVDDTKQLVSTEVAEGLWNARPGDRIVLSLRAPTPDLDWDIHSHANGGTQTMVAEFSQTSADYVFEPPADEQYFLLVRNHGSATFDLIVHMDIYGTANWAGWQN